MIRTYSAIFASLAICTLVACGDDAGGSGGGSAGGGDTGGQGGSGTTSTDGAGGGSRFVSGNPVEGTYLIALSAHLDNATPILFQGELTLGDDAQAPAMSIRLTPLRTPYREAADNQGIEPLTPIPPPLDLGPFPVEADGSFVAQFPEVQVTGKANCFSGNDLKATIRLTGKLSDDPATLGFVCGPLEGEVTSPIAVELTAEQDFFSMTLIEGGALPDSVVYDCAGDVSDPFSGG
jgi:hypothetical protein